MINPPLLDGLEDQTHKAKLRLVYDLAKGRFSSGLFLMVLITLNRGCPTAEVTGVTR